MTGPTRFRRLKLGLGLDTAISALALLIVFVLTIVAGQTARAQTFSLLHTFTHNLDGAAPRSGLTFDKAGNLYGTTSTGGFVGENCTGDFFGDILEGCGTVYRLKRSGSNWIFNHLYSFTGGSDGRLPIAGVIFGPNGSLYGTTIGGGGGSCVAYDGCGTVFNLTPQPTTCTAAICPWTETVIYAFQGSPADGENPANGDLIFDQNGNIYGTTSQGGAADSGTVYKLTPSGSGWTESLLYDFSGPDGAQPYAGLIFDSAGNLYGTTTMGGSGNAGTVFELSPAGSGWTENVIYSFPADGSDGVVPFAGLIFDQSGNLYGATSERGPGGGGTVFKLTPSDGSWNFSLLYSFTATLACGPMANLVMDAAGNLYGTTFCEGAHGDGSVFKLTPSSPYWTYTSLYDFTGGDDGRNPLSNVVFDTSGNLYGTNVLGGADNSGVVWKITP